MDRKLKHKMDKKRNAEEVPGHQHARFCQDGNYYDSRGMLVVDEELNPGSTAFMEEYNKNRQAYEEQVEQETIAATAAPEVMEKLDNITALLNVQNERISLLEENQKGTEPEIIIPKIVDILTDGQGPKKRRKVDIGTPDPETLETELQKDKVPETPKDGFNWLDWIRGKSVEKHHTIVKHFDAEFGEDARNGKSYADIAEALEGKGIISEEEVQKSPLFNK